MIRTRRVNIEKGTMARTTAAKASDDVKTTLGPGTKFIGTLKFQDSLRIKGVFEGDIEAQGSLYIDEKAQVSSGKLRTQSVTIAGVVRCDVDAAEKVEMMSTAQVYGNIRTARLRIADGVIFEGRCEMIKDPSRFDPFAPKIAEGS